MLAAVDEGYLIHVMNAWRAPQVWAETGSTRNGSDLDDDARRGLVEKFAHVVAGLVERGWLELREPEDAPEPLTGDALHEALSDPASWIYSYDLDHRMVSLMTSGTWDRLIATETSRTVEDR